MDLSGSTQDRHRPASEGDWVRRCANELCTVEETDFPSCPKCGEVSEVTYTITLTRPSGAVVQTIALPIEASAESASVKQRHSDDPFPRERYERKAAALVAAALRDGISQSVEE